MNLKSSWLAKKYIAHRGFHSGNHLCPENSLLSFEEAMKRDFAIELDVHSTIDNKIVVFHDDNLKRMTGYNKTIWDCRYDEIKDLTLNNSKYKIPLFEEVLEIVNSKVPVLVEIKNKGEIGQLEENLYEMINQYAGELAVQSFNPFSMEWFKKHAPNIIRGQLSGDFKDEHLIFYKKILLKNLMLNFKSLPLFINYNIDCLPNRALDKLKRKGMLILGWTAKSRKRFNEAKEYCDNVIFEGFDPRGDKNESHV